MKPIDKIKPILENNEEDIAYEKIKNLAYADTEVRDYLIHIAIREMIGTFRTKERQKLERTPPTPVIQVAPQSAANDRINNVRKTLFDLPVFGGKKLGDCDKNDLQRSSEDYRKQSVFYKNRSDWHKRIAEKMPYGVTVRKFYTEQQLYDLQEGKAA